MRKIIKLISIICILIIVLSLFLVKHDTKIYIGNESINKSLTNIDVQIRIDNRLIYSGCNVRSNPWSFPYIEKKLRYGFHYIKVSSKEAAIEESRIVFLIFNQYISVMFYSAEQTKENVPSFDIYTGFNPFVYE